MVRGYSESLISDPQIHTHEKTHCSHKQDHQPSNKRLLDHFPEWIQNVNTGILRFEGFEIITHYTQYKYLCRLTCAYHHHFSVIYFIILN